MRWLSTCVRTMFEEGWNRIICTWETGISRMSLQPSIERLPSSNTRTQVDDQGTTVQSLKDLGQISSAINDASRSESQSGRQESRSCMVQLSIYPNAFSPSSSPPMNTFQSINAGRSGSVAHTQGELQFNAVSPSENSVHAIIGSTLNGDGRVGFFGSSSAGHFMQNVKKMVQLGNSRTQQTSQLNTAVQSVLASGHDTAESKPVDYALPPRRRADMLMSAYWRYVHVLYPYLDKPRVLEDYENLWRGNESIFDERSFICLLNAIFALGSQIDETTPAEERACFAYVFYTRARELLDITATGSVRTVHSFLLLGQYTQSTNEPHSCWIYVGLAIRTAQSLGLHLPETSQHVPDIYTRDLLRKTWHGCVLLDRVISMTHGRPCMIGPQAARAVPFPLTEDELYLSSGSLQPPPGRPKQSAEVGFFVQSLKLFEILHDVMFKFYSINCRQRKLVDVNKYFGSSDNNQSSIFEVERRILKWQQNIPDHLKVGAKPQGDASASVLHRQAVILHQR